MRSGGTISGRFGGFAAGHFILSALGMGGWLALARASAAGLTWFPIFPGYAAGLMLLYLPAGWLTAGFLRWPRADRKTAGLAVLLPALVPWSIACAVPLSTLSAPALSLLAACYLYLVPLWQLRPGAGRPAPAAV